MQANSSHVLLLCRSDRRPQDHGRPQRVVLAEFAHYKCDRGPDYCPFLLSNSICSNPHRPLCSQTAQPSSNTSSGIICSSDHLNMPAIPPPLSYQGHLRFAALPVRPAARQKLIHRRQRHGNLERHTLAADTRRQNRVCYLYAKCQRSAILGPDSARPGRLADWWDRLESILRSSNTK